MSLGAVLIGPFEGSRWCGGCGWLWDFDVFGQALESVATDEASQKNLCAWSKAVLRDVCRGHEVLHSLVKKAEQAQRGVACMSTVAGDVDRSRVSHGEIRSCRCSAWSSSRTRGLNASEVVNW